MDDDDGMNSYLDKKMPTAATIGHHAPDVKPKLTSSFRVIQDGSSDGKQVELGEVTLNQRDITDSHTTETSQPTTTRSP